MKKKKSGKKKRQSAVLIIILLVVVAAVVAAGVFLMDRYSEGSAAMDAEEYFGIKNEEEAAVIYNWKLSEEKALYRNGQPYLSYSFASQDICPNFYYDEDIALLYYTTQNEELTWQLDATEDFISGPDGEAYISLTLLNDYTGLAAESYASPARIVISDQEETYTASVVKSSAIRYRAGVKSDILVTPSEGDTLIWLSDIDDEWSNVATYDGFTGYIKSGAIERSDTPVITRSAALAPAFDHILLNEKVSMAWHYSDTQENMELIDEFLADQKGLNIICPTWISLADDEGNIIWRGDDSYMEKTSAAGLDVWVMVDDADGDGAAAEVLNRHDARLNLVQNIVSAVTQCGAKGINIDFEALEKSDIPAFIQFLKELTKAAHENGLIVSVDNFVPEYTGYYSRKTQGEIVDYIIIMAYDEHTKGSASAGSVASLPFVKKGIEDTLEEVGASQVIIGVPFYTRGWEQDSSGLLQSEILGMARGYEFAEEHGISLAWNDVNGQYVGSSLIEGTEYSIWLEESESLEAKLSLADEYGLAGASAWRMGYEMPEAWNVWEKFAGN